MRADSICRAVIHSGLIALRPISPNCTVLPVVAAPRRFPRPILRNLVLLGCNIVRLLSPV